MMVGSLEGLNVVELGHGRAMRLAGHLLAEQGALVTSFGSVGTRREDSYLDRGKHRKPKGISDDALAHASIILADHRPQLQTDWGMDVDDLVLRHPDAVLVTFPAFLPGDGQSEDAPEAAVAALTGQYTDIHPVRELFGLDPVYTPLPLGSIYAAVHGATACVLAHLNGRPGHIEAPLAGGAMTAMSSLWMDIERQPARYEAPRLPGVLKNIALPLIRRIVRKGDAAQQTKLLGIARKSYPALMSSYVASDGRQLYLFAIDNPKLARRTLGALGLLDKAAEAGLVFVDPFLADRRDNLSDTSNLSRKWQTRLKSWIAPIIATRSAEVWERELSKEGVPCAVQRTTTEWMRQRHLKESGLTVRSNSSDVVEPGAKVWIRERPVLSAQSWTPTSDGRLLAGLKVVDLCSMVAGPVTGRTLAEYGAEVVKIESPSPRHGPRLTHWYGLDVNTGKRSILLDLKTEKGQAALSELLKDSDILLTNHLPEAMDRMGLSDDRLDRDFPHLSVMAISAYGGPKRAEIDSRPGYDPVLQAASGIMIRYGGPETPELHAIASCVDALTGYLGALGVACALHSQRPSRIGTSLAAAATLIQLPFAFSDGGETAADAVGQAAKGPEGRPVIVQRNGRWVAEADGGSWDVMPLSARRDAASGAPSNAAIRLVQHAHPHLGRLRQVAPVQAFFDGKPLPAPPPSEAPGHSTHAVLISLGIEGAKHAQDRISDHALPH